MQKKQLYNKESSTPFVPVTHFDAVYDDAGNTLTQWRESTEDALKDLQDDVQDIKDDKEVRFIRLGEVVNNQAYSQSTHAYAQDDVCHLTWDTGQKIFLLKVINLPNTTYYSAWSSIPGIPDSSWISTNKTGVFFYLTTSTKLTFYHWDGTASGLVPSN